MERMTPEELEKMVHAALRALPDRRAPATLEARVLAAVERRAALPWWHQSWSCWPQWVRASFLVFCGGVAGLLLFGAIYLQAGFDSGPVRDALAPTLAWIDRAFGLGRALANSVAFVGRLIPEWCLYAVIAFVAGLYAMLFGLGAAAYRTFWSRR
jgi:hypothetical protein